LFQDDSRQHLISSGSVMVPQKIDRIGQAAGGWRLDVAPAQ